MHNYVYGLQIMLNLTGRDDSSQCKYLISMYDKALELSVLRLFKSHVKSNSFVTTRFFIVNGRVVDDPEILFVNNSAAVSRNATAQNSYQYASNDDI